jgi:hypothetical protein
MLGEAAWYWTRSPSFEDGSFVMTIFVSGGHCNGLANFGYGHGGGVRPALNLKSDILVSEVKK